MQWRQDDRAILLRASDRDKLTWQRLPNVFARRRDRDAAANLRSGPTQAFATWADVTGVAVRPACLSQWGVYA